MLVALGLFGPVLVVALLKIIWSAFQVNSGPIKTKWDDYSQRVARVREHPHLLESDFRMMAGIGWGISYANNGIYVKAFSNRRGNGMAPDDFFLPFSQIEYLEIFSDQLDIHMSKNKGWKGKVNEFTWRGLDAVWNGERMLHKQEIPEAFEKTGITIKDGTK